MIELDTPLPELVAALRAEVAGEVRFDRYSRALYSTDASIYQIEPLGVVVPREADDIAATLALAERYGCPALPRGAGTSLAGQAVGRAVQVDCSKYLHGLLELNVEERWARVQPGLTLSALNRMLAPHGLMFGPDPASANRATIGGVIGNNATGAHSILYGMTADHVRSLRVAFAGGLVETLAPVSLARAAELARQSGPLGRLCREALRLRERYGPAVAERWPRHWRRASGYNLEALMQPDRLDLPRLVVGSEGTLAAVVEATIQLVPRPPRTALAVLHCATLRQAMEAVEPILAHAPAAVELMDGWLIRLALSSPGFARRISFIQGQPEALLVVEFYGETPSELEVRVEGLERALRRQGFTGPLVRAMSPEAQADVWAVRKEGLGLYMSMPGDAKPVSFVEDTSVPPAALPDFVDEFGRIIADHGTSAIFYAHASAGCLHIRPLLDLKRPEAVRRMAAIAAEVSELVLRCGGVMSGEHGDGLARSQWLEKFFGAELVGAFGELKAAFDPLGLLNPGKIVAAPALTAHLRYHEGYAPVAPPTHFQFRREGGFVAAVELCNGNGLCRKLEGGTMCPSYMATREEEHSTRGRANALRLALSGALPRAELASERMLGVLDLCVACKGCKTECPSQVDMARIKSQVLALHHQRHGVALRDRFFGHIHLLSRLASAVAPLANALLGSYAARRMLARALRLAPERPLPRYAHTTFTAWYRRRQRPARSARRQVVLFHDTFMTYNEPQVGIAALELLEAAGFEVLLPRRGCCGRPQISKGLLDEARRAIAYNLAQLAPYAERGIPIVGCEPSCILTFRDEAPDLFPDDPRAALLARGTWTLEEFLAGLADDGALELPWDGRPRTVLLHGHCHQKALVGTGPAETLLRLAGCAVRTVDSSCCGMAGSFGYEAEHYDVSLAMGRLRLLPAVAAASRETLVVASGTSCRQQIAHATGRQPLHLAEALRICCGRLG